MLWLSSDQISMLKVGQNFHICLRSGPRWLIPPLTVSLTVKYSCVFLGLPINAKKVISCHHKTLLVAKRNLQWLQIFSIRFLHFHEHNDNIGAEKNHLKKRWIVDSMGGRYQVWTNMATKSATSRTWVICNRWSWSTGLFQCCTQRIMIKIQLARHGKS